MKKTLFLTLFCAAMALTLNSCLESESVRSPSITFYKTTINGEAMAHNDTLFIGDTLQITLAMNPFYSRLEKFTVTTDRAYLKDSIFSDADFNTYCDASKSDKATGVYAFKGLTDGEMMVSVIQFIALQARTPDTDAATITLTLLSDADLDTEYNPVSYQLAVKLVNKPEE